jgi:E3 ubiquitin-protein ligase HUWE1
LLFQTEVNIVEEQKGKFKAGDESMSDAMDTTSTLLLHFRKRLIEELLGAIAQCLQGRLSTLLDAGLATSLCTIFNSAPVFGGSIFAKAASITAGLIHNEPTSFNALQTIGLPDAFLKSITADLLPSSKVGCLF